MEESRMALEHAQDAADTWLPAKKRKNSARTPEQARRAEQRTENRSTDSFGHSQAKAPRPTGRIRGLGNSGETPGTTEGPVFHFRIVNKTREYWVEAMRLLCGKLRGFPA
eukprot:scaffold1989_cov131-Pinguiococcus_pyrenoidosus.AAC.1